ncbi:MAG: primosomal protein N' [Armatimonadetes bacterium]|nr:primosomal protein N' [Armatimonadota bacterium]
MTRGTGRAPGASQMPGEGPVLVALDLPLRAGDAAFTFSVGVAAGAQRGAGVIVAFGRRLLPGIVLGEGAPRHDLRPVLALAGAAPLVPPEVVELAEWVAQEYLSSVGEALAAAVPWDALWSGARIRCEGPMTADLPAPARAALEAMERKPVSLARAARLLAATWEALGPVAESGALKVVWPEAAEGALGVEAAQPEGAAKPQVGGGLGLAVREAMTGGPRQILVAGWNRTPAYIAAIECARTAGWSTVAAFASVDAASEFARTADDAGLEPVLSHGDLPASARLGAWRRAKGARQALVVGTRATVFAPLAGPVLAIVDEEDGGGHKEERAPRYVTRAVAAERTRAAGVLVIGAATPPVATYARVRDGSLRLFALPSPRVRLGIVDLRRRPDPRQEISRPLLDAVRRTVRQSGRVVLFCDRKGYAGGLQCGECGAVERCRRCGVAMPYDRSRRRLRCRFCALTEAAPHVCSRCGAARLMPMGAGSERLVALLRRITPAVWRFDSDMLGSGAEPAALLAPFRERGGVLVATSLVLPYLGALRPDLVGFVAADRMLHRPEYRAAERALALIRTVGMATRALVLVETADPSHPAVRAAAATSLRPFYAGELEMRSALGYPPFRSLTALRITARTQAAVEAVAAGLAASAPPEIEILGPIPEAGAPLEGRARWEIVVKAADRSAANRLVRPLLLGTGVPRDVRTSADVDPHDL